MPPTSATVPRDRILLALICVLYVILASGYAAVTPYNLVKGYARLDRGQANPDEHAHYEYVQTVATGRLPVMTTTKYAESHQPPLYYSFGALVYHAAGDAPGERTVNALRALSILFGLLLVCVTYLCIRQIDRTGSDLALFCGAFVAFLPMQTSLDASVSNDSLSFLAAAFVVYWLVRVARVGNAAKLADKLMLGVALALCVWTKTLMLSLFVAAAATYAYMWLSKRMTLSGALRDAITAIGTGVLLGMPIFVRNTMLYGDPFAMHLLMTGLRGMGHVGSAPQVSAFMYWQKVAQSAFASYFGVFDSMFLALPRSVYGILGLTVVASLLGLRRLASRGSLSAADSAAVTAMAIAATCAALAFVKINANSMQAQGRYLYTGLVPFTFFFGLGLRSLVPPAWQPRVLAFAAVAMFIFDAACLVTVARYFAS